MSNRRHTHKDADLANLRKALKKPREMSHLTGMFGVNRSTIYRWMVELGDVARVGVSRPTLYRIPK